MSDLEAAGKEVLTPLNFAGVSMKHQEQKSCQLLGCLKIISKCEGDLQTMKMLLSAYS